MHGVGWISSGDCMWRSWKKGETRDRKTRQSFVHECNMPATLPGTEGIVMKKANTKVFPGGSVVKTPHFHCRRLGFDPYCGIKILRAARPKIIQKIMYYIWSENPGEGLPFHTRGSSSSLIRAIQDQDLSVSLCCPQFWLRYERPCSSWQKWREAHVHPCLTFPALPSTSYLTVAVIMGLKGLDH